MGDHETQSRCSIAHCISAMNYHKPIVPIVVGLLRSERDETSWKMKQVERNETSWKRWNKLKNEISWNKWTGTSWNKWTGTSWNKWIGTSWNKWTGTSWNKWIGTSWNKWTGTSWKRKLEWDTIVSQRSSHSSVEMSLLSSGGSNAVMSTLGILGLWNSGEVLRNFEIKCLFGWNAPFGFLTIPIVPPV